MKILPRQHSQTRISRDWRLTKGYICPSNSDAVCLWNMDVTENQSVAFNHDQLSYEEAGMR